MERPHPPHHLLRIRDFCIATLAHSLVITISPIPVMAPMDKHRRCKSSSDRHSDQLSGAAACRPRPPTTMLLEMWWRCWGIHNSMPNKIKTDEVVKNTGQSLYGKKLILNAVNNEITDNALSATMESQ